ncbi:MAG: response regulator [Sulfurimonas sp.]|nr:response regulator [Sulfurimonas sp.]
MKFTPQDGTIKVKIHTKNNLLIISVQDNGIGISKQSQKNIFNAFAQADISTTKKYGGTGLGLSISSLITKLMHGTLTLTSKEDIGSIFTLKIPINIIDYKVQYLIDSAKISQYKVALLSTNNENNVFIKLIKKYLNNFGVTNIIELNSFSKDGYDILFFLPNDSYNEKIILEKNIRAIAMFKSNTVTIANFSHIASLYAPFTPLTIAKALNDIIDKDIQKTSKNKTEELSEVQFTGNILIAEDNKTNQILIGLIMDNYGLSYEIANNGKIAVKMFKDAKFDLILMDKNMPELNGLSAMKQIKEYETKNNLKPTPVVALTANAMITDVKMFLDAGMDGFVAKPIDSELLEAELSKFLKKV